MTDAASLVTALGGLSGVAGVIYAVGQFRASRRDRHIPTRTTDTKATVAPLVESVDATLVAGAKTTVDPATANAILGNTVQRLSDANLDLTAQVERLGRENRRLSERVEHLETGITTRDELIEDLRSEVEKLRVQFRSVEDKLRELEKAPE